jgi:hypothetical protein
MYIVHFRTAVRNSNYSERERERERTNTNESQTKEQTIHLIQTSDGGDWKKSKAKARITVILDEEAERSEVGRLEHVSQKTSDRNVTDGLAEEQRLHALFRHMPKCR